MEVNVIKALRSIAFIVFTCIIATQVPGPAQAQQAATFQVIVNSSNEITSMAVKDVSRHFLKKRTKWDNGAKVNAVDQKGKAKARTTFSKSVLGKSVSAVKAYWQKKIFSGRGVPPPEKSSDSQVIAYVASHPGGVGYVSNGTATSKVKVIKITD